jgi:hypothetical protein
MMTPAGDVSAALSTRGFFHIPGALSLHTVDGLREQLSRELPSSALKLADPRTWPAKRARRVVEVEPIGGDAHWAALRESALLRAALDDALGTNSWELLENEGDADGRRVGPRYWYAPCVFPENAAADIAPTPVDSAPRICPFAAYDSLPRGPPHATWTPVSRRRFAGKGWHIDSGPGFANDEVRACCGDPRQGVVLLVALNDWKAGGGGTALVAGSQLAVFDHMTRAAAPLSHEALNTWVVERMRALAEAGRVELVNGDTSARVDASPLLEGGDGVLRVSQVLASAGDIFLLHPLLVHCGTSNETSAPRLMLNGMARVTQESFARDGGVKTMLQLEARV